MGKSSKSEKFAFKNRKTCYPLRKTHESLDAWGMRSRDFLFKNINLILYIM